tara:strand:+ start:1170 stop:1322 length:153 start_codon:yes stop_codon:yes gene_type:complete
VPKNGDKKVGINENSHTDENTYLIINQDKKFPKIVATIDAKIPIVRNSII